jgi:hypothetical protein
MQETFCWTVGFRGGSARATRGYERAKLIKQKPGVASHPGEIGAIHEFQFPE